MPSSFPGASPSSSASSPLSYLIPARPPPPPPPLHLMGQGQGYGASGVPTSGGGAVDVVSAAAVAPPGSRQGHPPLPRPPPRQCPRCGSANTKFCYFNNYSRSQPRYLCKACRRHWTEGGTLRDVPVGGGRKNRRGAAAKAASTSSAATATTAVQGGVGGNADVMFPDILRQVLFQPAGTMGGGGGGYGIDLGAWQQQMAAATAPPQQGTGALGGTAADYGALQYWSGWQQDDVPGLDGAC